MARGHQPANDDDVKNFVRWFCAAIFVRLLARQSCLYPFPDGTALVIAPHADDETLGCGGLIAAKSRRGQIVQVLFVTDSAASHEGHPTLTKSAIATARRTEALAALNLLGVPAAHVSFLDLPDGTLNQLSARAQIELRERIVAHIKQANATEVFAPYRDGGSSEHTSVQAVAIDACRACGLPILLEYPVWAWWNPFRLRPRLAFARDNYRLDLGELRAVKRQALACHRTQMEAQAPATAPALPPILARLCCGPTEFFFARST